MMSKKCNRKSNKFTWKQLCNEIRESTRYVELKDLFIWIYFFYKIERPLFIQFKVAYQGCEMFLGSNL